jgi:hypothetical protein
MTLGGGVEGGGGDGVGGGGERCGIAPFELDSLGPSLVRRVQAQLVVPGLSVWA